MTAPLSLVATFTGLLGLAIGSFSNVVVYRLPEGRSVVRPRSACRSCGDQLRARDEIPVISWLLLRGRCRGCSDPISYRYPLVELVTAGVFVLIALRFGWSPALPAYLYLGAVAIMLGLIDVDTRRLPNALTLPSYVVGAVLLAVATLIGHAGHASLLRALLGGAAMYAFYFLLRLLYPKGMGGGDVKLAGVLGMYTAYISWGAWAVGLFGGFFLGGVVSIGLVLAGRAGRKSKVPFGPFMLVGALLAVLVGEQLAHLYLQISLG